MSDGLDQQREARDSSGRWRKGTKSPNPAPAPRLEEPNLPTQGGPGTAQPSGPRMTGGYSTSAPFKKQRVGQPRSTEPHIPNPWHYGSRSTNHRSISDFVFSATSPSIFR
jgi:hypothetical protein